MLKYLNQNIFDGKLLDAKCLKSMREMEKMMDHKEIFICMFGQHNCGKSTLTNALLGEECVHPLIDVFLVTCTPLHALESFRSRDPDKQR